MKYTSDGRDSWGVVRSGQDKTRQDKTRQELESVSKVVLSVTREENE
jgi:hypothetical protein